MGKPELLRCLRVGQEWLDPADGKPVTIVSLDEDCAYPVLFRWGPTGGDHGRATAEGFIGDYCPPDLAAFLADLLDAVDRRTASPAAPGVPEQPLPHKGLHGYLHAVLLEAGWTGWHPDDYDPTDDDLIRLVKRVITDTQAGVLTEVTSGPAPNGEK